ncbi:hypothetical protein LUZ61_005488 [Rhynchospora tenuis]|uniref:Transcription repressor n=1 Tax=Rhynchospora tenuis TaxID=198213 RepID=A0AAD5ZPQ8_9POAL|nr:hypothetical protein LUZ61_005488 [Rhynchospora tenuis]
MDRNKTSHGGGIKHRLTQMLLRSACTASTANTTTSFVTISKNGTNHGREGEPPGTPSLSMLLHKHRHENQANASRPKLEKSSSSRSSPVIQVSIECGGRRALHGTNQKPVPVLAKEVEENKKKKKSNGSCPNSKKSSPVFPSSPASKAYYSNQESRRKKIAMKPRKKEIKKLQSNPYGFSTSSSAHSDMEAGLFSSEDEEEETHTLFSSKSMSSDSSELYHCTNKPKTPHVQLRKAVESPSRRNAKRDIEVNNARRDIEVNKHLISVSSKDRKVSDSGISSVTGNTGTGTGGTGTGSGLAVVKRSCNPYMDFRSSMVEMIVEQKVISAKEMERLLQSYLALNATHHHPVIVRAFEDICEAIFSDE